MAGFVAGPYTWTYGSLNGPVGAVKALGVMEDAPTLEVTQEIDPITGDNLGGSLQDGVYRGGNCFLDFVLQEYQAEGAKDAFWPWATEFGIVGCVGALMSTFADELVATPLNTGCAAYEKPDPQKYTFFKAVLAPGFPLRLLFGSRLRNVPMRFQILPFADPGDNDVVKWFKAENA